MAGASLGVTWALYQKTFTVSSFYRFVSRKYLRSRTYPVADNTNGTVFRIYF